MVVNVGNIKGYTSEEEVVVALSRAAAVIKLVCGVANNASFLVMLDAHDRIKNHPNYKQNVKKTYKAALKAWHDYEAMLVSAKGNRFFHVDDMDPVVRKRYGNITDQQYYEFWASTGGAAYQKTRPLITSLQNKYRLSLVQHGVKHADSIAWVMTALAALELARQMYESALRTTADNEFLPRDLIRHVFKSFDLSHITHLWRKALNMTESAEYDLDEVEKRNIDYGLQQLQEAWANTGTLFNSVKTSVQDYGEVFRTKHERRMAMAELNLLEEEAE